MQTYTVYTIKMMDFQQSAEHFYGLGGKIKCFQHHYQFTIMVDRLLTALHQSFLFQGTLCTLKRSLSLTTWDNGNMLILSSRPGYVPTADCTDRNARENRDIGCADSCLRNFTHLGWLVLTRWRLMP